MVRVSSYLPSLLLLRFAWAFAAATSLASASLYAGEPRVPFLRLSEQAGQLRFESCLPPGKGDFSGVDPSGVPVRAWVLVGEDDTESSRVRMFSLSSWSPDSTSPGAPAEPRKELGFSASLNASTSPLHYTVKLFTRRAEEGALHEHAVLLGRTCCGYYLSVRQGDGLPEIARGASLAEMMVRAPNLYRVFEQTAAECSRPGFELAPKSRYSPAVVDQVIDEHAAISDQRNRSLPSSYSNSIATG